MLQRLAGAVLGALLFLSLFVFVSFVLALVIAAGLVVWGWLWWRTRQLRRAMSKRQGAVIEGEFTRDAQQRIGRPQK